MRHSTLSAVAACLIEGSWLAAVVIVPTFFDPHTVRMFDADKILLLRSIALVIFLGLVVWISEGGRDAYTRAGRPLWRAPIIGPMLLLTGAYVLSTACSIAPRISLWGGYFRCQGLYTWLSTVTVPCAVVLLVRRRESVDRLVTMALLASLPPALYGLIQHLGRDPIDWQLSSNSSDRITSTIGNPIFTSAFMIMVVPLTLVRLIEQGAALFAEEPGRAPLRPRWRHVVLAATYLLLLVLQLLTIVYSQSRGPFIGLAAGLTVFVLVCTVQYRMRWTRVAVSGIAVLGVLLCSVWLLPHHRLGQLGTMSAQLEKGTAKVRTLIWQGAADLLVAHPLRAIVGYGPDTMALAYEPFYPPELGRSEGRIVTPDRAHNETFDALITTGVIGGAAEVFLFASIFFSLLRWLGMLETAADRNAFVALMGLGGLIGAVMPYILDGSTRFSGMGLPVGMVLGAIVYLGVRVVRSRGAGEGGERSFDLVLLGVLAAVVAHVVEIQVGIATVSTRLYFAAFAGLAVAIGLGVSDGEEIPTPRNATAAARAWPSGGASLHGAMVGLVLIVLTYEFSLPSIHPSAPRFVVLWLFLSTWFCGLILLVADSSSGDREAPRWFANVSSYAVVSIAPWLAFAALHVAWISWRPPLGDLAERLKQMAAHVANSASFLYLAVFVVIGLAALLHVDGISWTGPLSRRPRWVCAVYLLLLAGAVPVIVATNLNGARADSFNKLGATFERDGRLPEARAVYEAAQRLQPAEETYAISLGRVLMEQARTAPHDQTAERAAYLTQALAAIGRAQSANPVNPLHARNLARVHRLWASLAVDAAEQARHFDLAESLYAQATHAGPHNAALWKEWATLYLEWHQPAKALPKLDESLRLAADADTAALRARTSREVQATGTSP
jgi:tetratricopeptide (TPR) repeat protein